MTVENLLLVTVVSKNATAAGQTFLPVKAHHSSGFVSSQMAHPADNVDIPDGYRPHIGGVYPCPSERRSRGAADAGVGHVKLGLALKNERVACARCSSLAAIAQT